MMSTYGPTQEGVQPLPPIEGDISELENQFIDFDVEQLIDHESMRVYYQVHMDGSRFRLSELPSTTARADLILPTLRKLLTDCGEGASALDLACSPGYFSFKLAQLGIGSVVGVDVREDHGRQFELLNRYYGLKNVTFQLRDAYEFLREAAAENRSYDLCLLFGFLYHTPMPVELLRSIRQVCRRYLVIDTTLSRRTDPCLTPFREDTTWSRASSDEISLMPSLSIVPYLLEAAGFSSVKRVLPDEALRRHDPGGANIDYYFKLHSGVRSVAGRVVMAAIRRLIWRSSRRAHHRRPSPRAFFVASVDG